jgi:hypothetical protein
VALALCGALGAACGDRPDAVDVRTLDPDDMARLGKLTPTDSQVVSALRAPEAPGRIIYEPPVDLSLANARRTRRDLFPGDTTRRDASGASTARDTTGGDATADTSGGAARRPRP